MEQQTNTQGQVGLAGLQQRGSGAVVGSKNMEQYFNLAKKMSDGQLADVLSGKSLNLPQFVAMTEAMGRKQLRQAMQGAQAQQQAQQPSVKDQLLAEEAGLAALPAPNMASMDMAGGGIIAFSDRGSVEDPNLTEEERQALRDRADFLRSAKQLGSAAADVFSLPARAVMGAANTGVVRPIRAMGLDLPYIPESWFGGSSSSLTPYYDKYVRQNTADKKAPTPTTADTLAFTDTAGTTSPTTAASTPSASASTSSGKPSSGLPAIDASQAERRANPYAGMAAEQVDYAKLKEQGLGEGLLRLAGGILSKPGAAGYGAGMAALGEQAGLTRKEIAGLKKEARDYDFNIKKAEELYNQGQDELALKRMEAANLNKYRMASLAQEPGELRTLRAIAANPELASFYKGANKADMYSLKDAANDFLQLQKDNPSEVRRLRGLGVNTAADFRQYQLTGLPPLQVTDTLGKGANIRN